MGKGFMDFFREADADIFCIQESKLQEGQIQMDLEGYRRHSQAAMRLARRRRLSYVPVALGFVDLCHAAMAGA